MKTFARLVPILVLAACGAHRGHGTLLSPPSPGEKAYLIDGDFDAAKALLQQALDEAPTAESAFLLGDLLDVTGRPEEALERYFAALTLTHADGQGADAATASAMAVTAVRDRIERFYDKLERFMASIASSRGKLPSEAWFQLLNLKFGLLRTLGNAEAAKAALAAEACPLYWQSLGPAGPWVWSVFDEADSPFSEDGSRPERFSLGPGRGTTSVRDVEGDTCFVTASNPDMPVGGVTWVRTTIKVPRPATMEIRLQTGMAASVRLGGQEVLRRDTRDAYLSKVFWKRVDVPAGNIDVTVRLAGDSALPSFSLAMFDEHGRPVFEQADPELRAAPISLGTVVEANGVHSVSSESASPNPTDGPAQWYARMKTALWWDDMDAARKMYDRLVSGDRDAAPILQLNMAELTGADPSLPADLAYESARPYLKRALDREPRLWEARIGLSDRELDEERISEAMKLLEEGRTRCPEEVSILRRQASTFLSYGWSAEAEDAIDRIGRLMPSACSTLDWKLAAARKRSRFHEALGIAEDISKCNVFSESLLEERRRALDFDGATAEAERLSALQPQSRYAALEIAKSAVAAGHPDAAVDSFRKARDLAPMESGVAVALSDTLLATGDDAGAVATLDDGMEVMFARKGTLLEARAALEGRPMLSEYRVNGLSIIDEYRKEEPEYDAAAVYVLDRAVYLVDEQGGIVMLVHSIAHLKTDEAVESHGELSIPSGANLLLARTVKADGRVLEPQEVSGKETLSLPDLEPGDFVEYEYLLTEYPNQLFPGGFDTERFFFQDFETGFHRTEIRIVVPEHTQIQTDPRGDCPAVTEERKGHYRVLTWQTRNAAPHTSEPHSPSAVEFLPSIRVTARASWDSLFRRIQDRLADKKRPGDSVLKAVHAALNGIDPKNRPAQRQALYRWVMHNIEPSRDMFEEASHIIARKSGNRARAFEAMLKAAGFSSRLVLLKPGGEDETRDALPSIKQFYLLLVETPEDGLIDLSSEYVPYGFLPGIMRHRPFRYVDTGEAGQTGGGSVPRDAQSVSVSLKLSATGDATGKVLEEVSGDLAGQWRAALEKLQSSEYSRLFQSTYLSSAIPGAKLVRLDIRGLSDPETPLAFEYDIIVPKFASPEGGNRMYVKLPFATNFSKQSGGLPKRTVPLVLSLHASKKVEMKISLPAGFHATPIESSEQTVRREWGFATRLSSAAKEQFETVFEAEIDADRIDPVNYSEFLVFSKKVDRASEVSFVVGK